MAAISELPGRDLSVIRRSPFVQASVEEYDRMLAGKRSGRPTLGTYHRYGGVNLHKKEEWVAGLIDVPV